jgi:hypothetical protein
MNKNLLFALTHEVPDKRFDFIEKLEMVFVYDRETFCFLELILKKNLCKEKTA